MLSNVFCSSGQLSGKECEDFSKFKVGLFQSSLYKKQNIGWTLGLLGALPYKCYLHTTCFLFHSCLAVNQTLAIRCDKTNKASQQKHFHFIRHINFLHLVAFSIQWYLSSFSRLLFLGRDQMKKHFRFFETRDDKALLLFLYIISTALN